MDIYDRILVFGMKQFLLGDDDTLVFADVNISKRTEPLLIVIKPSLAVTEALLCMRRGESAFGLLRAPFP